MHLNMLKNGYISQLRSDSMATCNQFFQQDGARLHTTDTIFDFLNLAFGGKVISNRFPERLKRGLVEPQFRARNIKGFFLIFSALGFYNIRRATSNEHNRWRMCLLTFTKVTKFRAYSKFKTSATAFFVVV